MQPGNELPIVRYEPVQPSRGHGAERGLAAGRLAEPERPPTALVGQDCNNNNSNI